MDFLVHHLLRTSAHMFPAKEALVHGQQRLTYRDLAQHTTGLAYGLRRTGLCRGDRIGTFLKLSTSQVMAIFGILQAGGVYVPINHALFPDQVAHIVNDCDIKGLLTDESHYMRLADRIATMPSLEFLIVPKGSALPPLSLPTYTLEELCACEPPQPLQDIGIAKDVAVILYTSGSTGKPKGVMLTHANIMDAAALMAFQLQITAADRILAVLPFNYDAGLNQLMTALRQGSTLVLLHFMFARDIVQTLRTERISGLVGVPTLWSLLAQPKAGLDTHALPHLRYISNAGGTLAQAVLHRLRQALPTTQMFIRYGQTEAFLSTILPPADLDRKPTSMGKALPNTELFIINEHGHLCQTGEVGELVHRGPIISPGYWKQPALTARVFRPHPFLPPELCGTEKVCYSGDLVTMDAEGFYYFVGRRDAMIKSAGFRISPTEIEEALFASVTVRHAAVIGLSDEVLGQHIKAFVVAQDDTCLDPKELLAFCAERLPSYMVPKSVDILPELPLTSNGKVDYPAFRRLAGRLSSAATNEPQSL